VTADLHPHPSVVFTRLADEESALLHLDTKHYYSLNGTGTRIWKLLDSGSSRETIVERLLAEYDIDHDACESYVGSFLDELEAEGLAAH